LAQRLEYGRPPGAPSGWGYAVFSAVLGFIGILAGGYTLVVLLLPTQLPGWVYSLPIAFLGCGFWLLAPAGLLSGALVSDERHDVVRLARLGMILNTVAFVLAVAASCAGLRLIYLD
jgi:hypothetical protein